MRRIKQAGSGNHNARACYDREDRTITITLHGAGDEIILWDGENEPTNRELQNILNEYGCPLCK